MILDNDKLIEKIKEVLESFEDIEFAFVFGSYARGNAKHMSDIDIAAHFSSDIDLLELGKIIAKLEVVAKRKIDFVTLNNLYKKNPLLAFEIIKNSNLLFVRDIEKLISFKTRAQLEYFDTEKLRRETRETFRRRISERKFGKRNYA